VRACAIATSTFGAASERIKCRGVDHQIVIDRSGDGRMLRERLSERPVSAIAFIPRQHMRAFRYRPGSAVTTVPIPQTRAGSAHASCSARASVVFPALDAPFRTTITVVTIDNLPTGGSLIVDGANVVGSVPDGWWRDRAGAAARLRDRLAAAAVEGGVLAAVEVVLVVEGRARDIGTREGIRVVSSPGSGDDTIVEVAGAAAGTGAGPVTVVTADRGLRERVAAVGASAVGPGTLFRWLE
jgi:hypothetical protein